MFQSKNLPKDITSYDLLKMAAVLLMIVDHIGYYFYNDVEWFRVIGRMCVPIWFFLIGYANSRDLGKWMWIGCGILIAGNLIAGMYWLPLNILGSILIARMVLDRIMGFAIQSGNRLAVTTVLLTVLILPTAFVWEYGTQCFLLAMIGYGLRHKEEFARVRHDALEIFAAANLVLFLGFQTLMFGFDKPQLIVLTIGCCATFFWCWRFKSETYPALTGKLPGFVTGFVQLMGRRTLEIYVLHLLLFKAIGMVVDPERFEPFHFTLFISS